MKDAYSIDADLAQLNQSYDAMYEAYCRIYDRCGLPYVIVEAESGPIGGDSSHEFMVPCSTGEDKVLYCPKLRLRRQSGARRSRSNQPNRTAPPPLPRPTRLSRRPTSARSKTSVSSSVPKKQLPPSFWSISATASPLAALLRGDHELNEAKLRRVGRCLRPGPRRCSHDRKSNRRADGVPGAGRHQDSARDRLGHHGDADGRRRRQRSRRPPDRRRPRPRFPSGTRLRSAETPWPAMPARAAVTRSR